MLSVLRQWFCCYLLFIIVLNVLSGFVLVLVLLCNTLCSVLFKYAIIWLGKVAGCFKIKMYIFLIRTPFIALSSCTLVNVYVACRYLSILLVLQ